MCIKWLDEGVYKCFAENIVGEDERQWMVTINTPPQITETSVKKSVILKDETFVMECEAIGKPTPIISWTRNGRPLIDDRIEIDSENGFGRATISNVILEDKGNLYH